MSRPFRIISDRRQSPSPVKVSIILLDWSCRERFDSLRWLAEQSIRRDQYELIWVELYDRIVPEVQSKADVLITCGQRGLYHKHEGYNAGLLASRGTIVTICDSDAIFPEQFIESIHSSFHLDADPAGKPLVLMHYQWRTRALHPGQLTTRADLARYRWLKLWPNVGACMSVRRADAIRHGGFDEHRFFRGYMCGPYDLGWRLINAGTPEQWHDPKVALWHFAHENPLGNFGQRFSWRRFREIASLHIDGHALAAVEAFSTGRLLPRQENPAVFAERMAARQIGTAFEAAYAGPIKPRGFSWVDRLLIRGRNLWEGVVGLAGARHDLVRATKSAIRQLAQKGHQSITLWITDDFALDAERIAKSIRVEGKVAVVPHERDPAETDIVLPMSRNEYALLWEACHRLARRVPIAGPVGWHDDFEHILLAEDRFRWAFSQIEPGKRIALYGAGSHTRKAWRELLQHWGRVDCVLDDAPLPDQRLLDWPVMRPNEAPPVDVIILSSDQHEEKLWQRTEGFRQAGTIVIRLYGAGTVG